MIISLVGYMGSGKSHVAKILSQEMQLKLIDLDRQISLRNGMPIPQIFEKRGEIFFRRQERECLQETLALEEDFILSTGGGTPAYYNNMELLSENTGSVYLRASVRTLTERLLRNQKRRPLIANISPEDLPEFIAKHLFERNVFYSQAKYTVDTDNREIEEIVAEIRKLF